MQGRRSQERTGQYPLDDLPTKHGLSGTVCDGHSQSSCTTPAALQCCLRGCQRSDHAAPSWPADKPSHRLGHDLQDARRPPAIALTSVTTARLLEGPTISRPYLLWGRERVAVNVSRFWPSRSQSLSVCGWAGAGPGRIRVTQPRVLEMGWNERRDRREGRLPVGVLLSAG